MDTISVQRRSWNMSRIRSSGTKPEIELGRLVREAVSAKVGGRARLIPNARHIQGTPDIYVPQLRLIFFVDGCFFHGCPIHGDLPKSNTAYWQAKIERNQRRDRRTVRRLRGAGFSVWRLWEHDLKPTRSTLTLARIELAVRRAIAAIQQT